MLFYVFLVRARFGPKTGGGRISPPPNEKRWKKCLMKLGLKVFAASIFKRKSNVLSLHTFPQNLQKKSNAIFSLENLSKIKKQINYDIKIVSVFSKMKKNILDYLINKIAQKFYYKNRLRFRLKYLEILPIFYQQFFYVLFCINFIISNFS